MASYLEKFALPTPVLFKPDFQTAYFTYSAGTQKVKAAADYASDVYAYYFNKPLTNFENSATRTEIQRNIENTINEVVSKNLADPLIFKQFSEAIDNTIGKDKKILYDLKFTQDLREEKAKFEAIKHQIPTEENNFIKADERHLNLLNILENDYSKLKRIGPDGKEINDAYFNREVPDVTGFDKDAYLAWYAKKNDIFIETVDVYKSPETLPSIHGPVRPQYLIKTKNGVMTQAEWAEYSASLLRGNAAYNNHIKNTINYETLSQAFNPNEGKVDWNKAINILYTTHNQDYNILIDIIKTNEQIIKQNLEQKKQKQGELTNKIFSGNISAVEAQQLKEETQKKGKDIQITEDNLRSNQETREQAEKNKEVVDNVAQTTPTTVLPDYVLKAIYDNYLEHATRMRAEIDSRDAGMRYAVMTTQQDIKADPHTVALVGKRAASGGGGSGKYVTIGYHAVDQNHGTINTNKTQTVSIKKEDYDRLTNNGRNKIQMVALTDNNANNYTVHEIKDLINNKGYQSNYKDFADYTNQKSVKIYGSKLSEKPFLLDPTKKIIKDKEKTKIPIYYATSNTPLQYTLFQDPSGDVKIVFSTTDRSKAPVSAEFGVKDEQTKNQVALNYVFDANITNNKLEPTAYLTKYVTIDGKYYEIENIEEENSIPYLVIGKEVSKPSILNKLVPSSGSSGQSGKTTSGQNVIGTSSHTIVVKLQQPQDSLK